MKFEVQLTGPSGKKLRTVELERDRDRWKISLDGQQVHTDAGRHETRLETWPLWANRAGCPKTELPAAEARPRLEETIRSLGGTSERLPWHAFMAM